MHFKINKKSINVFLIICTIAICCYIRIENIKSAGGSVNGGYINQAGNSGCITCGGGGFSGSFQTIAAGYRVTIIDKDGTQMGTTHDYWVDWSIKTDSKSFCYYNKTGYDFLVNSKTMCKGSVSPTESYYNYLTEKKAKIFSNKGNSESRKSFYPMDDSSTKEFFVSEDYYNWLSKSSPFKWYYSINEKIIGQTALNFEYKYPDYLYSNNFSKFAIETFKHAISDLSGKDATLKSKAISSFEKLLKYCNINIKNHNFSALKDKYLLIEPLLAVWHHNQYGTFTGIYVGSLHDLYKLGYPGYLNGIDPSLYSGLSNVNPIIFNTLTLKNSTGKVVLSGCNADSASANDSQSNPVSGDNKENLFNNTGCAGIFTIELNDIVNNTTEPCDSNAKKLFRDYYKNNKKGDYDKKISNLVGCEGDKCKYIKSKYVDMFGLNESDIVCGPPSCEKMASYIYKECYTADSDNPGTDSNCKDSFEYAGQTTYKNAISKLKTNYDSSFKGSGSLTYADKKYLDVFGKGTNFCLKTTCDDLLDGKTNDSNYMDDLFKLYPKSSLLNSVIRNQTDRGDGIPFAPSCEEIEFPICEAIASGDCSNGYLTFDDGDKKDSCIRSLFHIAYNNGIVNSKSQSAYTQDIDGKKIYCSEKVTFNLPKKPSVKAGTLLSWGTNLNNARSNNSSTDQKTFGTMEISQHCYTKDNTTKIKTGTKLNWLDNVSTTMQISYDDNSKYSVNDNLNAVFKSVSFSSGEEGGAVNSDGKVTSAVSDYRATAQYTFDYNNKFAWFSKKDSSDKYIDYTTYSGLSDKDTYSFIGYGLPTALSTPTGNYSSSSTTTYLKAYIKDIGTNGRWNKYVNEILGKSSGYEYSCDFSIENEIFGYECLTGKCGSNNKPKGLDVAFRTIDLVSDATDLKDAFPGRDGNGRQRGRNWSSNGFANNANKLSEQSDTTVVTLTDDSVLKILNKEIYNKKPIYHINLTPSIITDIRESNKKLRDKGYDPYTAMIQYSSGSELNDYSYSCVKSSTTGNGYVSNACYSNYLTYLVSKNVLDGTCIGSYTTFNNRATDKIRCKQNWWD